MKAKTNSLIDSEPCYVNMDPVLIIHEMQHRMKNYLQLILSLINLQIQEEKNDKEFLENLKERVFALSLVNEEVYYAFENRKCDLGKLLTEIITNLENAYKQRDDLIILKHIDFSLIDDKIAVPVCLIFTELMINCFKYAFPKSFIPYAEKYCEIKVLLKKTGKHFTLVVSDNGVGKNSNSLCLTEPQVHGSSIISDLVLQINGKMSTDLKIGTSHTLTF